VASSLTQGGGEDSNEPFLRSKKRGGEVLLQRQGVRGGRGRKSPTNVMLVAGGGDTGNPGDWAGGQNNSKEKTQVQALSTEFGQFSKNRGTCAEKG